MNLNTPGKATLFLPRYEISLDDPCCYPLGFMYVSSLLKEEGWKVKVLNFNLWEYDVREEFRGQDAILFTGNSGSMESNEAARAVAEDMGIETVIGGSVATFAPEKLSGYDSIISGEIDRHIDIDLIHWPDYDGFGIDEYHRRHGFVYMGVLASRGCPFSCSFCPHTCDYRERDITLVGKEIMHYKAKYGAQLVCFNDNTLNVSKERFVEICRMMKNVGIAWSAAIRTDVFDEEMAALAKDSGCVYMVVGIESFQQGRLESMNKRIRVEDTVRTLNLLHTYGIRYHGNIVLGMDGEDMDSIAAEIESMPKCYNVFPVLAQPFVGTRFRSALLPEQRAPLNALFREYAESKGKRVYPVLQ
jgi:radical SAM superfamily enzyme YgiQ (UPF0313 family)